MKTPTTSLTVSYYQPWVYAGTERFTQLINEELRQGRSSAFFYYNDAGAPDDIEAFARQSLYKRFALYEVVGPDRLRSISAYAMALSGRDALTIGDAVRSIRPTYIRIFHPAPEICQLLDTPALKRVPLIYDVMDLWEEFEGLTWWSREAEAFLLKRAAAVTTVSTLLSTIVPRRDASVIPNAVDPSYLQLIRPANGHRSRAPSGPKRILYTGSMWGTWFDWNIALHVSRTVSDAVFAYVGFMRGAPDDDHGRHVDRLTAQLAGLNNVKVVGAVPHNGLIPWLRWGDVDIIPFDNSRLSAAVSPLKIFEYLGAGAEVVSSGIPDVEGYPGVHIASDAEEFVEQVRHCDGAALSHDQAMEISLFCDKNTWTERLKRFDEVVSDLRDQN